MFKTDNAFEHCLLGVVRKRCRQTVWIYLDGIDAFRFKKDLVAFFFRETHYLVFDGGTVSGAYAFDDT